MGPILATSRQTEYTDILKEKLTRAAFIPLLPPDRNRNWRIWVEAPFVVSLCSRTWSHCTANCGQPITIRGKTSGPSGNTYVADHRIVKCIDGELKKIRAGAAKNQNIGPQDILLTALRSERAVSMPASIRKSS
jgi:hypothetical protein